MNNGDISSEDFIFTLNTYEEEKNILINFNM